jgi:Gene product 88
VSRKRTVKPTVNGETPHKLTNHKKEDTPERKLLKFGRGNAKLDNAIFTFSLPAGYSCPFARLCLSRADRRTGRIKDGPETQFRCYAASTEMRPFVRRSSWHNFDALHACQSTEEMTQLIFDSISAYAGVVRIHTSGDFFSQDYFDAWLEATLQRPRTLFYTYTKSLPFWIARLDRIPENFVLTASKGGQQDHLIETHNLRYAQVVFSEAEAQALGLPIDYDDTHAMQPDGNFALLIHGTQPAGTEAAKATAALRSKGWHGYGRKTKTTRKIS